MGFGQAIHSYEIAIKDKVNQATFGHLAPQKNVSYKGEILFCKSGYSNTGTALIDTKFDSLQDSPWLYDAIIDELNKWNNLEDGCIYKMNCTFRNYRFYGKPKKIYSLN